MGNNNKTNIPVPPTDDLFDVKKNLKKLRTGKSSYNSTQTETDNIPVSYQQPTNSSKPQTGFSDSYGANFTESVYNRYDKLKDELNTEVGSLKDVISSQGTDIRKELNDKFQNLSESKVSFSTFWSILGALVGFVIILAGVIYTLSYSDLVKNVKDNTDVIKEHKATFDKINLIDSKVEKQGKAIIRIDSTLKRRK